MSSVDVFVVELSVLLSKFAKAPKLFIIWSSFSIEGEEGSDSIREGMSSCCWGRSCAFVQTNGSAGGDGGAGMFSVDSGGIIGCDVVTMDGSEIAVRVRCCVLLDRTKFLSAGRIVLEICRLNRCAMLFCLPLFPV